MYIHNNMYVMYNNMYVTGIFENNISIGSTYSRTTTKYYYYIICRNCVWTGIEKVYQNSLITHSICLIV